MSTVPGSPLGRLPALPCDENGNPAPMSAQPWSPVSSGGQARELAGAEAIANPSPNARTMGGGCAYTVVDLAGVGSGVAPDGRLQPLTDWRIAAQQMDPNSQQITGGGHARGTDFNGNPVSPPAARPTPPG